jgi:hypothetical protein
MTPTSQLLLRTRGATAPRGQAAPQDSPLLRVALLLSVLASARPALASGPAIGGGGPIDRPAQHTLFWCSSRPLFTGEFTANGPQATIAFTGKIHKTMNPSQWMRIRIDDVAVVQKSVYLAHSGAVDDPVHIFCTQNGPQEAFLFDTTPPQEILFLDLFASGVSPAWNLGPSGYYIANDSAQNSLSNPVSSPTGGSLGLGQTNDPAQFATVSATINGLQDGVEYVLTFWWSASNDDVNDAGDLWIDIYGTEPPTTVACQLDKVTALDAAASDEFGESVAISGTQFVVGAHLEEDAVGGAGSAYLYQISGSGYYLLKKLKSADPNRGDEFGRAVALTPGIALVGAWLDDDKGVDAGTAFVFSENGGLWTLEQKLVASDGAAGDWFGSAVAISGNRALVGAHGADPAGAQSGEAYVFQRSGATWSLQQKLTAFDGAAGDNFGTAVALDGNVAVIGAPGDDHDGLDAGSAYVFRLSGVTWALEQKLSAPAPGPGDDFGHAVAVSGGRIVVGAPLDDGLGADAGSAAVFESTGSTWTAAPPLLAGDGVALDRFGESVSISGDVVVVGADKDDPAGSSSGSAYVFRRSGTGWEESYKFIAPDGAAGDQAGVAVAASGDRAIAGADLDDTSTTDTGSAYLFAVGPDCNRNGLPDTCDIATAFSRDVNENGVPDECEGTAIGDPPPPADLRARLLGNAPNPFNPRTTIVFELPQAEERVTLRVYDAAGALVKTLIAGPQPAGRGSVVWEGDDRAGHRAPNGVYRYVLRTRTQQLQGKMAVVR